jgi:hypothetical protein
MAMFSPNINEYDVKDMWDSLGTYYTALDGTDRLKIEALFKAIIAGGQTLLYNLLQANAQQFYAISDGFIETGNIEFIVNYDTIPRVYLDTVHEVTKIDGSAASLATELIIREYSISAYNAEGETPGVVVRYINDSTVALSTTGNHFQWDPVAGAVGYKIYKRVIGLSEWGLLHITTNTHYVDTAQHTPVYTSIPKSSNTAIYKYRYTLETDYYHLCISELTPKSDPETSLIEGVDYKLVNGNIIEFYLPIKYNIANSAIRRADVFRTGRGVALEPILNSIMIPAMNNLNVDELVVNNLYTPFLKDWGTESPFDKARLWARHLKHLFWGLGLYNKIGPTLKNLERMYGLVKGYPFSYEDGQVTTISGQYITISGENLYTYGIGNGHNHVFSSGVSVNRFDILASGLSVNDYYTAPTTISGIWQNNYIGDTLAYFVLDAKSTINFTHSSKLMDSFKKMAIPAGLLLHESI